VRILLKREKFKNILKIESPLLKGGFAAYWIALRF